MKKILAIAFLTLLMLSFGRAQQLDGIPQTTTVVGTDLMGVLTNAAGAAGQRRYRAISINDLARYVGNSNGVAGNSLLMALSQFSTNLSGGVVYVFIRDGALFTNIVEYGSTTNRGAGYYITGSTDPELRITSSLLPQTFVANSRGIGTRPGGGQDYLTFSPEGVPIIEVAVDGIRPVNGSQAYIGSQIRPFTYSYFDHWVSASNIFLGPAVKIMQGNLSPEGIYAAGPQSIYLQTNQASGIGLWLKTNGYASTGWWLLSPGGGGGGGVSDGDKGDITVSSSASVWTVDNDAISYAKLQNISSQRVIGRNTAGAGDPEEVNLTQILDWVGSIAQGDILYRGASGWARLPAGTSGQLLQTPGPGGNPVWTTVGTLTDADKGDVTVTGGGTIWTIDNGTITDAKIAGSGITTRSKLPGALAYEEFAAIANAGSGLGLVGGTPTGWVTNLSGNLLLCFTNLSTDHIYKVIVHSAGYSTTISNAAAIYDMNSGRGGITALSTNGSTTLFVWIDSVNNRTNMICQGPLFSIKSDGNCLALLTNFLTREITVTNTCTGLSAFIGAGTNNIPFNATITNINLIAGANISVTGMVQNGIAKLGIAAATATLNGNLDTLYVTNRSQFQTQFIVSQTDTNAIIDLAKSPNVLLVLTTNAHLVFSNVVDGITGDIRILQDTNGTRSILSTRVVGGTFITNSGTLFASLGTNASDLSRYSFKTHLTTNVMAWQELTAQDLNNYVISTNTFGVDNRIIRSDQTARSVQVSPITLTDDGSISGVSNITLNANGSIVMDTGSASLNQVTSATYHRTPTNFVYYESYVNNVTLTNQFAQLATNANNYYQRTANSNAVNLTNIVGLIEKAVSSTIELNCNDGARFVISNRVTAATTLVITNSAYGQKIEITIIGEVSGGTSRTITLIPHLGHLVADMDTFGTALATSASFTLTNGNAAQINWDVIKMRGTNVVQKKLRQFAF